MENIVTRSLCGIFNIVGIKRLRQNQRTVQNMEIVSGKISIVLPEDVIGHKIYDNFHSRLVSAAHKCLKLRHPIVMIVGQRRIYIEIVAYSIRRACLAFDYRSVTIFYAMKMRLGSV